MSHTSIAKIFLLGLILSLFPLMGFAEELGGERKFEKRPGHSHSPLPCGTCHLADYPELKPKLQRVTFKAYKDECGSCHLAYQPELLPKASWKKVMEGLKNHFGDDVTLNAQKHYKISRYLYKNSADNSKAVRAKGIMTSLAGATPLRITEAPYITKIHQKVGQDVIKRESIKSLSNCEACHISADGALYYPPHIVVPQ